MTFRYLKSVLSTATAKRQIAWPHVKVTTVVSLNVLQTQPIVTTFARVMKAVPLVVKDWLFQINIVEVVLQMEVFFKHLYPLISDKVQEINGNN